VSPSPASPAAPVITVDIPAAFSRWRTQWDKLAARLPWTTPYTCAEWVESCLRAYPSRTTVFLLVRGDSLRAGLAAEQLPRAPSSALHYPTTMLSLEPRLGTVRPASPVYVTSGEETGADELLLDAACALRAWNAGVFQYCEPPYSSLGRPLRALAARKGWRTREGASASEAFVDLTQDERQYLAGRSKHFRRTLANVRNRFARSAGVRFADIATDGAPWPTITDTMVHIHRSSWQHASTLSPLAAPYREAVLTACRQFHETGRFRCAVLYFENHPVSYLASLVAGDTLFPVAIGYDLHARGLSPGTICIDEAIRHYRQRGLKGILLGPVRQADHTGYKELWATELRPASNVVLVKPWTVHGALDFALEHSRAGRAVWWHIHRMATPRAHRAHGSP